MDGLLSKNATAADEPTEINEAASQTEGNSVISGNFPFSISGQTSVLRISTDIQTTLQREIMKQKFYGLRRRNEIKSTPKQKNVGNI
ncbi:CLUMA_CG006690, isoform A [Clunio marinus]|uniref:CLUMA_CG006690, isoform A n=1 Tax=Clunio marinus TaxID=568069 RepID=A0A1J1I2N0_9DIPT|nr:CLUMA_CG006690, isoform A [Clunio marinus]